MNLPPARSVGSGSPRHRELPETASRVSTCTFPVQWSQMGTAETDGRVSDLSQALGVLIVRLQLQAHDGDLDGALATYAPELRVADHLGQLPNSVGWVLASSVDRITLNDVTGAPSLGDLSPAACQRLADLLVARDYRARVVRAGGDGRRAG